MSKANARQFRLPGLLLILFVGLSFLTSCSSQTAREEKSEKAIQEVYKQATGKDAKVDMRDGKIHIQTTDGKAETDITSEWPADMPGDVPVFAMAKVKGVNKRDDGNSMSWMVGVGDMEEGAVENYVEALKAGGWKIDSSIASSRGGSVAASKDKLTLIAMFSGRDKSGSISIKQSR